MPYEGPGWGVHANAGDPGPCRNLRDSVGCTDAGEERNVQKVPASVSKCGSRAPGEEACAQRSADLAPCPSRPLTSSLASGKSLDLSKPVSSSVKRK